jgi:ABC-type uncharacterized transport system ATPase subunit
MKTFTGLIKKLEPNQIFVFGSNTRGIHGAGAALFAMNNFGAIYGQARGLQGQSYAIITKDLTKDIHPSISREIICKQIDDLYIFARHTQKYDFLIAYCADNNNLCGYSSEELAEMFARADIPENIVFEEEFLKLVNKYK